ncbi:hypothetical protein [Mycobacterium avium]|uniref:hypothetical protein n=1 Tax=Mycobacterium avium TaxID=1764 RepID=UPI00211C580D|nr:hypothetical protein [Mycobacterium avium]
MADPDRVAADLAAIRETLAGIGLDDQSQGPAADAVRAALAQRGTYLDAIAQAARSVAQASEQRRALVAERDASTPSDSEIRAAQEAVIEAAAQTAAAAGTADEPQREREEKDAIDRLADLLNQKREAQKRFESGENASAESLDTATKDLSQSPNSAGALSNSALGPLAGVLSSLMRAATPHAGAPVAPAAVPGAGADPVALSPEDEDPVAALVNRLGSDDPREIPRWAPELGVGAGQTHVSSADDIGQQMPTLSGVATNADVSGKGSAAFAAGPATAAEAGSEAAAAGAGGMPMSPMMSPMAARGGGVAQGKQRDKTSMINRDPDLTGEDIASEIATSGVIGRGEGRRL